MRALRHAPAASCALVCIALAACGGDRESSASDEQAIASAGMIASSSAGAGGVPPSSGSGAVPVPGGTGGMPGMSQTAGSPPPSGGSAGTANEPPPTSGVGGAAAGGMGGTNAAPDAGAPSLSKVLDRYQPLGEPFVVSGSGMDNLSGITWNPDTGTYFGVINLSGVVYELADDLSATVRRIAIEGSDLDYEAIAYLGRGQFALARESNAMVIVTIDASTTRVGGGAQELAVAAPPAMANSGAEAVAYDAQAGAAGRFWVMQEIDPMRVFRFDRPGDSADHDYTGDLQVSEPFDPEQAFDVRDISDAVFDARTGHLLVLSQEDHRVLEVMPDDGTVVASLVLPESFGAQSAKWEGIALGPDDVLAVASEGGGTGNRAQLYRFAP